MTLRVRVDRQRCIGAGNCIFISTLRGRQFHPDPKAKPICGTLLDEKVKL